MVGIDNASADDHTNDTARAGGLSRRTLLGGIGACGICALGGYLAGHRVTRTIVTRHDVGPDGATKTSDERKYAQPDGLFRIRTDEPIVALTFDDGPDPAYTPTVLDLLAEHKAAATFFCVGVNAAAHRGLVHRLVGEGHSIGNHTYDHRELELLTPDEVQAEIEKGQRALINAGIPRPEFFRPPKGFTDEIVGILADADRYRTVFWDACVERFVLHESVDDGVAQVVKSVRPGSIILAHDGGTIVGSGRRPLSRARTMEALPGLLKGLQRRGFELVDLPTLLARTNTPVLPTPGR